MELNPAVLHERIANMLANEHRLEAELARTNIHAQNANIQAQNAQAALRVSQLQVLNAQGHISELIDFVKIMASRTGCLNYGVSRSNKLLRFEDEERRAPSSFIGATYVEQGNVVTVELHQAETPAHVEELRSRSRGLPRGEVVPVGSTTRFSPRAPVRTRWLRTPRRLSRAKERYTCFLAVLLSYCPPDNTHMQPFAGTCIILGTTIQAISLTHVPHIVDAVMSTTIRAKLMITSISLEVMKSDMNLVVQELEAQRYIDSDAELLPMTPPPDRLAQV
jgi:hypothetical protein